MCLEIIFQTLTVAGWGFTGRDRGEDYPPRTLSRILHEADLTVVPCSCGRCGECGKCGCERCFTKICTEDLNKSWCEGDSGGPLMSKKDGRYYLSGIASQSSCQLARILGHSTRVANYIDWIKEKSGNYLTPLIIFLHFPKYIEIEAW